MIAPSVKMAALLITVSWSSQNYQPQLIYFINSSPSELHKSPWNEAARIVSGRYFDAGESF